MPVETVCFLALGVPDLDQVVFASGDDEAVVSIQGSDHLVMSN